MLSLAFVLAFIGAAVGLLVGILIFGEVSEAIECPAGGGGGGTVIVNGTFATNQGSLSNADGIYYENDVQTDFISVSGAIDQGVYQEGTSSLEDQGEIRFGTASQWQFIHGLVGSNLTSINFWLKGDVDGSPEYPIIQTIDDPSTELNDGFLIYAQSDVIRMNLYTDGIQINEQDGFGSSTIPPDDSQWHMLTLLLNKGNATSWAVWYLDGIRGVNELSPNVPYPATVGTSTYTLTIGHDASIGPVTENSFAVDDVTVWHGYKLTEQDITDLYDGGAGSSAGATGESIALSSQVLHVTFDLFNETPGGGGGGGGTGSAECESAKETAWTVIGIIPVALFFALFAIFGAMGRPQ